MKKLEIDYVTWREGNYFVSRCMNVEVASFGETQEEAIRNLVEAVELYLEDHDIELTGIEGIVYGKELIDA
ncbi:MAG: type II toxin-antitoxin system HicB family antitoxin [Bacteroidetes bacterium]|nr:type II toxin-antitoxin system HicB family antitoxin [Bacteroidota bacterium]